jgi:hypothetical protein
MISFRRIALVATFLGLVAASPASAIPVSHTLTAATDGTGSGVVSGVVSNLARSQQTVIGCPISDDFGGDCDADLLAGTVVILTARPDGRSSFEGWTGCDNNIVYLRINLPLFSEFCVVTMTADRNVTATFDEIPGAGSTHSPGTFGTGNTGTGNSPGNSAPTGGLSGGEAGGVLGNVYSDPSIELLSRTGLVKQIDLKLTCGTLTCGGLPVAGLTLAGETIGLYSMQSARLAASSSSIVHMVTSSATRQKLRAARKAHPNARPRLKIWVLFGMSNQKTVSKTLNLRLA